MKRGGVFCLIFGIFTVLIISNLAFALELTGFVTEQDSPSNVTVTPFTVLALTFNGSTTNFTGQTEATYRDFPNVILEKDIYGKVWFKENLDLVTMAGSDMTVNFDGDLNISDNLIYVENSNLAGIAKNTNLSLYEISFSDPQVLHNGVVCTDCTEISYSGGIYIFEVDSFSGLYTLRETPVSPVCGNTVIESGEECDDGNTANGDGCSSTCQIEDEGGGGGGGGGAVCGNNICESGESFTCPEDCPAGVGEPGYDFMIEPSFLQIRMDKGTYYQRTINITNNGTNSLTISVFVEVLEKFIFPEEGSFVILPGESKLLRLDVYVSSSRSADVYVGKIRFVSNYITKELPSVLQVNEKGALFDIRTEVLKKYVPPGGRVRANISIINKGDLRNFDVSFEYKAIDFSNNEYTIKKEDFEMGQYYNNIFYLDLPKDIKIGNYLFYAKVSYQDVNASSYDTFVVEQVSTASWFLLILIIVLAMYLAYRYYKNEKMKLLLSQSKVAEEKKVEAKKREELPLEVPKLPEKLPRI